MATQPECPEYQAGSGNIWPFSAKACGQWGGGSFCKLPGHFCRWRAWWLPGPTWEERALLAFKGEEP